MDKRIDLAITVAITIFGAWLVYYAANMRVGSVADPLGESGLIRGVGYFFVVSGAGLGVRRVLLWHRDARCVVPSEGTEDEPGIPAKAWRAAAMWLLCLAYFLLLPVLGYLLVTPAFLLAGMVLLGLRRWVVAPVVSVAFTLLVYGLFQRLLNIRLPEAGLF